MKDLCLVSVGREFVTAVCYFYEHTRNSEHFDMMRAVFFCFLGGLSDHGFCLY